MNIATRLDTQSAPMLSGAAASLQRGGPSTPVLATPLAVIVGVGVAGFVGGFAAGALG